MLETQGLQISLSRLIRYTYGGLLIILLAATVDPQTIAPVIDALGTILAPLAAMGLGTGIYVVHRYVIGEIILFPLVHSIHAVWDRIRGHSDVSTTSTIAYLRALGVTRQNARSAYNGVRRRFFDPSVREKLDIEHGELHVLYITVEETLLAAIYFIVIGQSNHSATLFVVSALTALSAIVADIRQHQVECHMLKTLERDQKVSSFLKEMGYL